MTGPATEFPGLYKLQGHGLALGVSRRIANFAMFSCAVAKEPSERSLLAFPLIVVLCVQRENVEEDSVKWVMIVTVIPCLNIRLKYAKCIVLSVVLYGCEICSLSH